MNTRQRALLILIVIASTAMVAAPIAQSQEADQRDAGLSNTWRAARLILVTMAPDLIPLGHPVMAHITEGRSWFAPWTKQYLGVELRGDRQFFDGDESQFVECAVELIKSSDSGRCLVQVALGLSPEHDGPRPAAQEVVDQVCQALASELEHALDALRSTNAESWRVQREMTTGRLAKIKAEHLDGLRESLREATGRVIIDADAIRESLAELDNARQHLGIELAGQNARMGALEQQIARIGEHAEQDMGEDSVTQELKRILELRMRQYSALENEVEQGMVPESEMAEAQAEMAEIRIRIAERRADAGHRENEELLREFNSQLRMLAIEQAEAQARLQYAQDKLEPANEIEQLLQEYEHWVAIEQGLSEALRDLTMHEVAPRQLPQVVVLDRGAPTGADIDR